MTTASGTPESCSIPAARSTPENQWFTRYLVYMWLFARDFTRLRSKSLPTVGRERVDLRAASPPSETR